MVRIRSLATQIFDELIEIRRHLHRHPELSFEEAETAAYIASVLDRWGIEYVANVAGHGLIGHVRGKKAGEAGAPVVALRADMDALPIAEQTGLPFASERSGVMHACGHDVHTTCLLGAAWILRQLADELPGTVRLIFQPAEEKLPGGARGMIEAGALRDPVPDAIIGQHINPRLPAGTVGFKTDQFMASVDDLHLTVRGDGGHAAHPHETIDPVVAAANVILSLQQVVSRRSSPDTPSVLSIGRVEAGGATNVLPDTVEMAGTFRTMNEEWRRAGKKLIAEVVERSCAAYGVTGELRLVEGYPSLRNDRELTEELTGYAVEYLGAENVKTLPVSLGGEDFAYYTSQLAGCFYNLGVTSFSEARAAEGLHSSKLIVDERAIETGAGLLAWNAYRLLRNRKSGSGV